MKITSWILACASCTVLSACGGGSSMNTNAAPPAAASPTPANVDFTAFVESQWKVADTGEPTKTNDLVFTFPDEMTPGAFDAWLSAMGT
jgi:hypothetical protein